MLSGALSWGDILPPGRCATRYPHTVAQPGRMHGEVGGRRAMSCFVLQGFGILLLGFGIVVGRLYVASRKRRRTAEDRQRMRIIDTLLRSNDSQESDGWAEDWRETLITNTHLRSADTQASDIRARRPTFPNKTCPHGASRRKQCAICSGRKEFERQYGDWTSD